MAWLGRVCSSMKAHKYVPIDILNLERILNTLSECAVLAKWNDMTNIVFIQMSCVVFVNVRHWMRCKLVSKPFYHFHVIVPRKRVREHGRIEMARDPKMELISLWTSITFSEYVIFVWYRNNLIAADVWPGAGERAARSGDECCHNRMPLIESQMCNIRTVFGKTNQIDMFLLFDCYWLLPLALLLPPPLIKPF